MPREACLEGPAADPRVDYAVRADGEGVGVEGLFRSVEESEGHAPVTLEPQRIDNERRIFDAEVTPVVAVRKDGATVVRMARDRAPKRVQKPRVLHGRALVPEATCSVEHDVALPRASVGTGSVDLLVGRVEETKRFPFVRWVHGHRVSPAFPSLLQYRSAVHDGDHLSATRAYYDEFAEAYEAHRDGHDPGGYHDLVDELEVALVERYGRGRDVLEAGCGTGLLLRRIALFARSARGIHLSEKMIAKARARGLDVTQGSATKLPFADASFDVACSFKVLAHVEDVRTALAEMARVVRPGGHVLAEFYNPVSLRGLAKRLGPSGAISRKTNESAVYTRFDPPWRIGALRPHGTRVVASRGVRILTPFAGALGVPILGALLRKGERLFCDSPLRYLGGFWIAVLEKTS